MSYVALVTWLVSILPNVPNLVKLGQAVFAQTTLDGYWAAIKSFGDAVVPLLDTLPPLTTTQEYDAAALADAESQLAAAGISLDQLKQLLPLFQTFLPLLLQFLKK